MSNGGTKHILLIDDEEDLVWSLVGRLRRSIPEAEIEGCSAPLDALARLKEKPYDLVITDLRMPEISGLDVLIAARRANPNIPVLVMTAHPTEQIRAETLRYGSVEYLEKPFNYSQLVRAIQDTVFQTHGRGVSGAVSLETLPDLIQLFALSNITGALEIKYGLLRGSIWFDRGAIVHASTHTSSGEPAFFEIMTWRGGEFAMERSAVPPERSIFENATGLIMEALRRQDEAERDQAEGVESNISSSLFPQAGSGVREPAIPFAVTVPNADATKLTPGGGPDDSKDLFSESDFLRTRARNELAAVWDVVEEFVAVHDAVSVALVVDLSTGEWTHLVANTSSSPATAPTIEPVAVSISQAAAGLIESTQKITQEQDGCLEQISDELGVALVWRGDSGVAFVLGQSLESRAATTWFRSKISTIARSVLRVP